MPGQAVRMSAGRSSRATLIRKTRRRSGFSWRRPGPRPGGSIRLPRIARRGSPMTVFSVLDLSPIVEGGDAAQALANTLDLARHAEAWGYRRFWLAEHHNMPGIASAATSIVIGHVAAGTRSI